MANTLEQVRHAVMELPDSERQLLAEEIIASRWNPGWRASWSAELERRRQRLESGDDQELSAEEVFRGRGV